MLCSENKGVTVELATVTEALVIALAVAMQKRCKLPGAGCLGYCRGYKVSVHDMHGLTCAVDGAQLRAVVRLTGVRLSRIGEDVMMRVMSELGDEFGKLTQCDKAELWRVLECMHESGGLGVSLFTVIAFEDRGSPPQGEMFGRLRSRLMGRV